MKYYYQNPNLKLFHGVATFIHFALIIVDFILGLYLFQEPEALFYVALYHSPFLAVSLVYHLVPFIGRTVAFRWIVKVLFGFTTVMGILLYISGFNEPDDTKWLAWGIALIFLLPGALITGSLLAVILSRPVQIVRQRMIPVLQNEIRYQAMV